MLIRGRLTVSLQFAGLLDASPRRRKSVQGECPELSPDAFPGQRISEGSRCRRRPDLRPHAGGRRRDGRTVPHPSRRWGSRTRPRTSETWASATARTAGPDTPPVFPPSHGSPGRCGCGAIPRSVLISETASAPCSSAAAATSAGEAQLGVSLTISGLAVRARTASSSAGDLARVGAEHQAGLDVRAGDVELERGDLVALAHPFDQFGDLVVGAAHDVDDQRDGQLGELRQVLRRNPSRPLFGRPIEFSSPLGQLVQPRRRVALARRERDRLGHERGEREALEQRVAERTPGGDRVERAGRVDDRVREVEERSWMRSRQSGSTRRAPARRRTAARSRSWSARRSRSRRRSRRPCRTRARAGPGCRARRRSRARPRASRAGRRRRPRRAGRARARRAAGR